MSAFKVYFFIIVKIVIYVFYAFGEANPSGGYAFSCKLSCEIEA